MEEIEISSWKTLDAVKKSKNVKIVETVGNLQTGHYMSVFVVIEDDFLELCYSDSTANFLRRYDDRYEFDEAIEERRQDAGESLYEEEEEEDDGDDEDEEDEDLGGEDEEEAEAEDY